jgi:hypothetical protein
MTPEVSWFSLRLTITAGEMFFKSPRGKKRFSSSHILPMQLGLSQQSGRAEQAQKRKHKLSVWAHETRKRQVAQDE